MSTETRKILEQIFTGQMPVKRNNPKPGQSPFYYVAFQSDDNDEEPIAADGADNNGLGESSGDRKTFLPAEGVSGFLPAVPSLTEPMPAGRLSPNRIFCRKQGRMNGKRNVKLPMRR